MITLKLSLLAVLMWFASCKAGVSATAAAQQSPAPPAATSPTTLPRDVAPAAPPGAVDPEIDALLTRLEQGAADLTSFAAKIAYEKEDAILGRAELRVGEIIYRIDDQQKSFAVLFNQRVIPPNRLENRLYHYVFDGRWLAEIDHENKQFIKREIVPPGKSLDPLKLGEGPFPLPIGQAKVEVLARFDIERAQVPADGLLKSLADVDGLMLTPRPGTPEADDYQRIEIYYDRHSLLPVGINAMESNGDRKTVRLTEMRRNPALTDEMLRKLDIAEPDPRQWKIDIRPWSGGA